MFEFVVNDKVVLKLLDTINADQLFQLTDSGRPYLKKWLPWVDGTKSALIYISLDTFDTNWVIGVAVNVFMRILIVYLTISIFFGRSK